MLTHHTIEEADEERMSVDGDGLGTLGHPHSQSHSDEEQPQLHQEPKKKPKPVLQSVRSLLDYWQVAFKLLELTLCILCTALVIDPLKNANVRSQHVHQISLIFATYIGYMIIISVVLLGRLCRDRLPYKTSAIFALVGAGMFLATGCVIFSERDYFKRNQFFHPNMHLLNMVITSAVFAIINSVVFAIDAILILRYQNDL